MASLAIVSYLLVVFLGPLTVPSGAPHLTVPVARAVGPVHQALYLGHGYRFFAPDPGESHSIWYSVQRPSGRSVVGHFPDRDQTSPRLLYHRWFMLSETLFREGNSVPTRDQLSEIETSYQQGLDQMEQAGLKQLKAQLVEERDQQRNDIQFARRRRDMLLRAISQVLLDRHDGDKIRLVMRTRRLPTPEEVRDGLKLDDPRFVSSRSIGEFSREQIASDQPLPVYQDSLRFETLPSSEGESP